MKPGWILAVLSALALGLCLPAVGQSSPMGMGSLDGAFATLTVSGELAYPGELDWFSFEVVDDATPVFVRIHAVGGDADLRVLVFEDDETYITGIESGEASLTLAPGAYRIRVDSVTSATTAYVLTIYNGVETESNDGVSEADVLGTLDGRIVLAASLMPTGDADFYRFDIPATGLPEGTTTLRIENFGAVNADTNMVLYRYDDEEGRYLPIASDDDSGDGYWSALLVTAGAGDRYVVRVEETVYPLEGIVTYGLMLDAVTLSIDTEPNDTSATAIEFPRASSEANQWEVAGLLDTEFDVDFYALNIPVSGLIEIATGPQGTLGEYDTLLSLYQPNGDLIAESDDTENDLWSRINVIVEAGDYFVTVKAGPYHTGVLPYQVSAFSQSVDVIDEAEPNDSETESQSIDVSETAILIRASIGLDADVDSFRIVLDEETTIACETGPEVGASESYDTTLSIYDEDLWDVAYNDDANGMWSRIETTLPAGIYYIVVESYYSDEIFDYTLLVTTADD